LQRVDAVEEIILIGFGGHAKSVADCIERQGFYQIIGYTDMEQCSSKYEYLGTDDVLPDYYDRGVRSAVIGVGYLGKGEVRQKKYNELKNIGFSLPIICDPSAVVSEDAEIGEGTFIGKGAIINANADIGKMCIINTGAIVEHDCVVNDFSHIAVGAVLCGGVKVEQSAFIGANATVIQGITIPSHSIIGAGMTIRKRFDNG
jgi:sugar O-acyltransferase (sialic acid O-acetyltransferase NeuD family)